MIGSMVIFGTIGICRRYLPLPSEVLSCARGVMGSVFCLLLLKATNRRFDTSALQGKAGLLILTGALIGFNWILLFEAYSYTTVAVATLCYYMQPVIVTLVSPLVLKERITLRKGICVAVAIAGMILVSGVTGGGGAGNLKGVFLGLGAAALYSSVVILNKKIQGVPIYEKTIVQLMSAAAAMLPYMLARGTLQSYSLSASQVWLLLAVGIVHTGIAYALYFGAVEKLPAQTTALFSYIDPVTAILLSAAFLREPLSAAGIAGTVMILGSLIAAQLGS